MKYVQEGYYKCVSEFTPRPLLKHIEALLNIETSLGRGRAWFFFALNDSLTESYMKCFQDNRKLAKKFYTADAIVNDTQVRRISSHSQSHLSLDLEINCFDNALLGFRKHSVRPENSKTIELRVVGLVESVSGLCLFRSRLLASLSANAVRKYRTALSPWYPT